MAVESGKSSANGPCLVPQGQFSSKKVLPLKRMATVVGSEDRCHLHLISSSVSKHHAIIVTSPGEAYVSDLGSRTKVLINGEAAREAELSDGDRIQIGKFEFSFDGSGLKPTSGRPKFIPYSIWVDGRTIAVTTRLIFIGRRPGADVHLSSENVSICHAAIFQCGGKIYVRDMHSRTGTKVNGGRIHQEEIQIGDQIRVGESQIRLMPAIEETPAEEWAAKEGIELAEPVTAFPTIPQSIAVSPDIEDEVVAEPAMEEAPSTQETTIPFVPDEPVPEAVIKEIIEHVAEEPVIEPVVENEPAIVEPPIVEASAAIPEPDIPPAVAPAIPLAVVSELVIPESKISESPVSELVVSDAPEPVAETLPRYRKTRAKIRRIPPPAKKGKEAPLPLEQTQPVESPLPVEEPLPQESALPVEEVSNPAHAVVNKSEAMPASAKEPQAEEPEFVEPPVPVAVPVAEVPPLQLAPEVPPPHEMEIELNLHPASEAEPVAIVPVEELASELPPISLENLNLDLLQSDQPAAPVESPTVAFPSDDLSIEFHDNEVPRPLIGSGFELSKAEIQPPPPKKPDMLILDEPLEEPKLVEPRLASPVPDERIEIAPLEKAREFSPEFSPKFSIAESEYTAPHSEPVIQGPPLLEVVEKSTPIISKPDPIISKPEPIVSDSTKIVSPKISAAIPEPIEIAPPTPIAKSPEPPPIALTPVTQSPVEQKIEKPTAPAEEIVEAPKILEPIIPMSAMGNQTIVATEHHLGGLPVYLPRAEATPPPAPVTEITPPAEQITETPIPVNKVVEPQKIMKPPRPQQAPSPVKALPPTNAAPPTRTTPAVKAASAIKTSPPTNAPPPQRPPPPASATSKPASSAAPAQRPQPPRPAQAVPVSSAPAAPPLATPRVAAPAAFTPPRPEPAVPQRTAFDGLATDPIGRDELLEAAAVAAAANMPLSSEDDSNEQSPSTFSTSVIPTPEDQTAAAAALMQPVKVTTTPARRRKVIPFLMLTMILSMAAACAAWMLTSVKSHVQGTLTFLNKSWVSGTDDGNSFESQQRGLLSPDQTRQQAIAILHSDSPAVSPGFLTNSQKYMAIVNTVDLSSGTVAGVPQTTIKIAADGDDPTNDGLRMKAILQALIDANGPSLRDNRRLLSDADQAAHDVDDVKKKLDQARPEIDKENEIINLQPSQQDLDRLTEIKRKAQVALDRLNDHLDSTDTQAQSGDAGLAKLRAQLAALKDQLQTAQDEQSEGISHARTDLENAAKEFDDQLSNASTVLDKNSQLKQFFDSAGQSQAKVRELINTLLVDGEDLEKQLEDVHREVNDAIQRRQEEKWAADKQLQDLLAQLGTVRRQFNALTSQGNGDPKQLDELKKQEADWQSQVDARKAQLPVDPNEVGVSDGLEKLSRSLKYKLQREHEQIDVVLNPMEKQLAALDPDVAALPDTQQEVARQLRQRLDSLNQARKQYALAIASDQQSPSDKILNLQKQIDDVKSQLGQPQAESDSQMRDILQPALDSASRDLQTQQKRAEEAQTARGRLLDLSAQVKSLDDSLAGATANRYAKAELASHAFDIRPLSDSDVSILSDDPRKDYCLYSVAGLALFFALWTMVVSTGRSHQESESQEISDPPHGTVAAIPITEVPRPQSPSQPLPRPRVQRPVPADRADSVFLDDESETMVVG